MDASKNIFMIAGILLLDFELFIGDLCTSTDTRIALDIYAEFFKIRNLHT